MEEGEAEGTVLREYCTAEDHQKQSEQKRLKTRRLEHRGRASQGYVHKPEDDSHVSMEVLEPGEVKV